MWINFLKKAILTMIVGLFPLLVGFTITIFADVSIGKEKIKYNEHNIKELKYDIIKRLDRIEDKLDNYVRN